MDYELHYDRLIMRARLRDNALIEGEWHHAIPKCMGGTHQRAVIISDMTSNLVKLTYYEHLTAHRLLCRIYPKNWSLAHAIVMMVSSYNVKGKAAAKMYAADMRRHVEAARIAGTGKLHNDETKAKLKAAWVERRKTLVSDQTRQRISAAFKGKTQTAEACQNVSKALMGHIISDETKAKISAANIGKHQHTKEFRAYISSVQKGKLKSEETKQRMKDHHRRKREAKVALESLT